ncbi:MAG: hypothetical protein LAT76_09875 [Schleiferiaceae bacterium]|nr:hypothetical protein [Schleiferiaceae bacterium]
MKKRTLIFIFLAVIAIIAAISNPDAAQHREALKTKIKTAWQKESASKVAQDDWDELIQGLGNAFGGVLVEGILKESVSTSNYVLFSFTKINWEGEQHIIGIGVFGNVFFTKEVDQFVNDGVFKLKSKL